MLKKVAILILGITITCSAQERFQSGEFKGFTKSPTEHIICRIECGGSDLRGLLPKWRSCIGCYTRFESSSLTVWRPIR
jgi:hypothetical protein